MGFRDPGLSLLRGHTGLYVGREPDNASPLWASATAAIREPLERVERSWRGVVMDTYALEKLTGWTPELSPSPESPLYGVRALAGDFPLSSHDDERLALVEMDPGTRIAFSQGGDRFLPGTNANLLFAVALTQQVFGEIGERGPRQSSKW